MDVLLLQLMPLFNPQSVTMMYFPNLFQDGWMDVLLLQSMSLFNPQSGTMMYANGDLLKKVILCIICT